MVWRAESRVARGLLAVEHGQRIVEWTQHVAGGGSFGIQTIAGATWRAFGWSNNNGASSGAAAYFRSHAQMGFAGAATDAHVVHLRLNLHSNRTQGVALGPATCVHSGGGGNPGNAYFAEAMQFGGTPTVAIRKSNGGLNTILNQVPFVVREGDILSLGYRRVIPGTVALAAYVNGVEVVAVEDSAGAFNMAGLAARVGLWGSDEPAIDTTVGHWSTEWWVTDGWASYATLPPAPASLSGDLRCEIRSVRRYTDDPQDRIKFMLSGCVTEAKWSFRRHGGCQAATIEFRPQQDHLKDADVVRYWEDPSVADWDDNDWLGGLVYLSGRYSAFNIAANPAVDERLWTGRVVSCEVDRRTGVVSLEAEGLSASLSEMQFVGHFDGVTIRDAVTRLIRDTVAKGERSTIWRALWMRFNPAKITGIGSVLDYRINMEFEWESCSSVLNRLVRLLPDGFVWGVDRVGDFYLSYQQDNYEADMGASGGALSIVTFDTANAERWSRKIDVSGIRNEILVIGADDDAEFRAEQKVLGYALSAKSVELWGARQEIVDEGEASDFGIAAKLAQAQCKLSAAPRISARLTVTEKITGQKSFWDSLVNFAPTIAVNDRFVNQTIQPVGMPRRAEFMLRRYGDEPAYSVQENGATGWVELPAIPADEMGQDWLVHQALRFTHPHPGGAGTYAFIFGRPSATEARKGWGGLYWARDTGRLWWFFEDLPGNSVGIDTTITVDPVTPANAVVHFSLVKRPLRWWDFYNGGPVGSFQEAISLGDKAPGGEPWRWFRPTFNGAGADLPWRGELDQFWFLDGHVLVDGVNEGISGQAGGYGAFVARNNGRRLGRHEGIGLLAHIPFNESLLESRSNGLGHKVWRAAGAEGLGEGVAVRTSYPTATTPADDGAPVTPLGQNGGHLVGLPKRWGGPLRLSVESVTYELIPHSHRIRRSYSLGDAAANVGNTVARVEEEVRTQSELLRREAFPT